MCDARAPAPLLHPRRTRTHAHTHTRTHAHTHTRTHAHTHTRTHAHTHTRTRTSAHTSGSRCESWLPGSARPACSARQTPGALSATAAHVRAVRV
jgi:hypothetical protein